MLQRVLGRTCTSSCSSRSTAPAARASSSGRRPSEETARRAARDGERRPARLDRAAPVALSTAPTLIGDQLAPRHVDLRPFAVNDGNEVWVLPGGLTRVALPEGALVVNSSQGGGSKDTWVLAAGARAGAAPGARPIVAALAIARVCTPRSAVARDTGPPIADGAAAMSVADAEPDRRVAVLDRPLRRAGRRHRAHPRRVRPPAARGPRGSTRSPPAGRCWQILGVPAPRDDRRRAPSDVIDLLAFDPTNSSRRSPARGSRPRERPRRPRDDLQSSCGRPQRHVARDPAQRVPRNAWDRTLPRLRPRARGAGLRARRLDDEPRRRLAVPRPRAQPRARRHDRAAAVDPVADGRPAGHLGHRAAACGADETFLHTHGGMVDRSRAVQFLLLDRLVPSLGAARADHRRAVPVDRSNPQLARDQAADPARRVVGQARTALEYADVAELVRDLSVHLVPVQEACASASQAVSRRYFTYATPLAWAQELV